MELFGKNSSSETAGPDEDKLNTRERENYYKMNRLIAYALTASHEIDIKEP